MVFNTILIVVLLVCGLTQGLTDTEWENWKLSHNKAYESEESEATRRQIWSQNYKLIDEHNSGDHSFKLALNHFADLTNEEYHQKYLSTFDVNEWKSSRLNATLHETPSSYKVASSIDWSALGYVTGVKNQGQCGSCWAFSATGALEAQYYKYKKSLVSLSEQQLVDCSWRYGNAGCNGGLMDYAFAYIRDTGFICSSDSYPYVAYTWRCKSSSCSAITSCKGYKDVSSGSEDGLTSALSSIGPVSVAIDASQYSFQFYSSGVFYSSSCSSSRLNHGVLAVGYGTYNDGSDYYIVKNSWGTSWGDAGYIKMARNRDNNCGIATAASYPVV